MIEKFQIGRLLLDIEQTLRTEDFVLRYRGEEDPESIDLAFLTRPPAVNPEQKSTIPGQETYNARCLRCADRTFPVKVYRREGRLPVLLLHGPAPEQGMRPDRSSQYRLGSAAADDLLDRLLHKAGFATDDLFIQEFLACHFKAQGTPVDWERRALQCRNLVVETIQSCQIKVLIAIGWPGLMLLGPDMAAEYAQSGQPALFEPGAIPFFVLRSFEALAALEDRRKKASDVAKKNELIQQEKSIKNRSLAVMQQIRSLV